MEYESNQCPERPSDFSLNLLTTRLAKLKAFCEKTDFFDSSAINSLLKSGSARQIWYLLNFALWWEEYIRDNINEKND